VRGSLSDPNITGLMEMKDASFNLKGLPNGIEKANAVIRFNRNRANIESFRAFTGGGELNLGGFVGFGGNQLVYRLQANAERVRVRYPEAVSTTFDAALNLTGSSERSMLSGTLTVTRIGLNPRTDIGSLLASSAQAVATPVLPNPFLGNMQLDVRVLTSPDAELLTSLTRDIQPEADLRLRGSPTKPAVLGRVSVNQGEIQFFGNKYRISQGDIRFFNPLKIEPTVNLDLETRVRGITVTINLAGELGKLNVNYRSDPPLQSSEIVALLTVGRAPGSSVTPGAVQAQGSVAATGGNSLLGQAISTPLTGRLQRFFGVSRIKIDPDLTGVTNTPQARLTIEQQLTRDITVTYITSLNQSQQQIVRFQWDFSRDYSLLGIREENGILGFDFQFQKRFK
jgi:translocation and assembly module TamB